MPASITLTVSHLPTSSSFFLSALQPLDYTYRGRSTNTIGFGPASSPNTPADFWITQEIPGVPAGAAHVAFPATNRAAVQSFFVAALKAGGKIHGEPTVRDSSGYYSAAVIDFDGNSIEAVYRPTFSDNKENDVKSMMSSKSSMASSKAPSTVSRTTVSHAAPLEARSVASVSKSTAASQASASVPIPRRDSGDIFNNILDQARSAANLAKQVVGQAPSVADVPAASAQNSTNSDSGDAIMGTLLGVAAGAALHYAFSNWNNNTSDHNSNEQRPPITGRSVTEPLPRSEYQYQHQQPYYRAIEAPPSEYGQRTIKMEDHDYASAIQPISTRSRVSKNSGSAIATPFGKPESTTSRTSRQTGAEGRMIEPPRSSPPTSYKAPSVITTAETVPVSVAGSSISQTKSKHSHRSSSSSRSHTSRHSDKSEKTVVRITETFSAVKGTSSSPTPARSESGSKASTIKAVSKAPSTVIRNREPEEYPLPASRASTWIGSFHDSKSHASKASEKSKHSEKSRHSSASKHSERKGESKSGRSESGRNGMSKSGRSESGSKSGRSESGRSGMSKSVVGKIREMETLDVTPEEVGPEDSVSQGGSGRARRLKGSGNAKATAKANAKANSPRFYARDSNRARQKGRRLPGMAQLTVNWWNSKPQTFILQDAAKWTGQAMLPPPKQT